MQTPAAEARWIIGSGGMLGQALVRSAPSSFRGRAIPWGDPDSAIAALRASAMEFGNSIGARRWQVLWAAGAAVVATDDVAASAEFDVFRSALTAIRDELPRRRGAFFLASSAGGVYAGAYPPPFSELSRPVPVSPYGALKMAQEEAAHEILGDHARIVIGRFSNLYGPGQNLRKPQGLISRLCLASLTRQTTNLYVPLETIRDYLYVDDAAQLTWATMRTARDGDLGDPVLRVLGSGEHATVAQIIDLINRVSHRSLLLSLGVHESGAHQARDLRTQSEYSKEHSRVVRTTLLVGISRVLRRTAMLVQRADI